MGFNVLHDLQKVKKDKNQTQKKRWHNMHPIPLDPFLSTQKGIITLLYVLQGAKVDIFNSFIHFYLQFFQNMRK